ncbi:MAG: tetratricopeptide repeat protein [Myxococcota bacterium]
MLGSAIVGLAAEPGRAATDPVEEALSAARADVEAGRCEQAQERLAPIAGLENRARLLAGQCLIRAGRYPEALSQLDRARGARDLSGSQLGDVELYRGVALYHLERYAEARTALTAAEGLASEPAELALYRGLIALRDGDSHRAAPDLEAAALLSPALTEPVASYYAGLAWQGAEERDKARAAFERVVEIDGEDGAWGRQARTLLGSTEPHPYSIRGSLGVEWDSNVILRGGATQFTSPDSPAVTRDGQRDWRGVWTVDGGVQLVDAGNVGAGITAGYSGNAHADLADFNTHYPRIGGYVVNRLTPETTAQIRYEFGAAWVDEKSFMRTQLAEAGLSHTWEKAGTTVVVADFLWNDLRFPTRNVPDGPGTPGGNCGNPNVNGDVFQCGPPGLDEGRARDRDGEGVGAAIEQRYAVPLPPSTAGVLEAMRIAGGYRYRYYVSQGREWKHMSHIASGAIELEFPRDFRFSTRVSYEFRDFSNPSTFPDRQVVDQQYTLSGGDRQEHQIDFFAELEKALSRNLSVSTRWTYLDNESNRKVYDYDRHIVGAYVNVRFD